MTQDKTTNQSWGGRFSEPVDAFVARFTASVDFDKRLYNHDIQGSIAHATMLAKVGVLTDAERDTIIDGLNAIRAEIEAGHDYGIVTLGLIQQAGLQADQLGDDGVDLFAQPEADIGGDLVVT